MAKEKTVYPHSYAQSNQMKFQHSVIRLVAILGSFIIGLDLVLLQQMKVGLLRDYCSQEFMLRESPYTQMISQNGCLQPIHWIFYVPYSTYSEPAFWNIVSLQHALPIEYFEQSNFIGECLFPCNCLQHLHAAYVLIALIFYVIKESLL